MSTTTAARRGAQHLNPEQQDAVDAVSERLLVMAPVGTGKTTVLTLRAANAIAHGVPPAAILCLSFTNKAAREMKDRLVAELGKTAREVSARTFHGLCATILRADAEAMGIPNDFVIYDEEDAREIFGRLWRERGLPVNEERSNQFEFALLQAAAEARLSRYDEDHPRQPDDVLTAHLAELNMLHLAGSIRFKDWLAAYHHELRENHALDFTDLILGVNLLFARRPDALARWQRRFSWMQVDEVQDTSRAEYQVLAALAAAHRQLSFFGDLDQTIYEWRGSAPFAILERYRREFDPVREIHFTRNYRSTRAILNACASIIHHYPNAVTREIVPQVAEEGEPVLVYPAASLAAEAGWIARSIARIRREKGVAWRDMVVLTRTNFAARDLSAEFERLGVPHVQVEQFKFFQREEIKNALAHTRLVVNRHDGNSLHRVLKTPPKGIGEGTLRELSAAPHQAGLRLADLLDPGLVAKGEPFAPLLDALAAGRLVVFDLETTGLDIGRDEIVEIAGARSNTAGVLDTFHSYVRPARPVGQSFDIHGLSDDFLAKNGREPAAVLAEFESFCGGAVLAGHNVWSFDLPMLRAARRRAGLADSAAECFDTLDITRRLYRFPRYTLEQVAKALGLSSRPSHRAADDVAATVELLRHLAARLGERQPVRFQAVRQHAGTFARVAASIDGWSAAARLKRPAELLDLILEDSGLKAYYARQSDAAKRLDHLDELRRFFALKDDPALEPWEALWSLLALASFGTELDRQMEDEDRVRLLTVHQAKGLEFDTVFLACATDREFPSPRSLREGRLNEEHRLFYVAASRAKRRLFASYSQSDQYGRSAEPSRFLAFLP